MIMKKRTTLMKKGWGTATDMSNVLVLGGAGFIGAHIVRRFISEGDKVTIVDGMLPKTGAKDVYKRQGK